MVSERKAGERFFLWARICVYSRGNLPGWLIIKTIALDRGFLGQIEAKIMAMARIGGLKVHEGEREKERGREGDKMKAKEEDESQVQGQDQDRCV